MEATREIQVRRTRRMSSFISYLNVNLEHILESSYRSGEITPYNDLCSDNTGGTSRFHRCVYPVGDIAPANTNNCQACTRIDGKSDESANPFWKVLSVLLTYAVVEEEDARLISYCVNLTRINDFNYRNYGHIAYRELS